MHRPHFDQLCDAEPRELADALSSENWSVASSVIALRCTAITSQPEVFVIDLVKVHACAVVTNDDLGLGVDRHV